MMTGGPDGDLGANQIQSFKGRICLLVDGGSVLFDPEGLDREELLKLALARHTQPRLNSLAYPAAKLGPRGFRVTRAPGAGQAAGRHPRRGRQLLPPDLSHRSRKAGAGSPRPTSRLSCPAAG